MLSWRDRGELSSMRALAVARGEQLQQAGHRMTRCKIEAGPDNADIPQHDGALQPGQYFESHLKVALAAGDDVAALTALAQRHAAHLSRNALRRDGSGTAHRFVTQRLPDAGLQRAREAMGVLSAALAARGMRHCARNSNSSSSTATWLWTLAGWMGSMMWGRLLGWLRSRPGPAPRREERRAGNARLSPHEHPTAPVDWGRVYVDQRPDIVPPEKGAPHPPETLPPGYQLLGAGGPEFFDPAVKLSLRLPPHGAGIRRSGGSRSLAGGAPARHGSRARPRCVFALAAATGTARQRAAVNPARCASAASRRHRRGRAAAGARGARSVRARDP